LSDLDGGVIDFPTAIRSSRARAQWHNVGGGSPLSAWLRAADPETTLQWHLPRMTPQKRDDCAIEVEFAWLGGVLAEQDYKLAKAHALNGAPQRPNRGSDSSTVMPAGLRHATAARNGPRGAARLEPTPDPEQPRRGETAARSIALADVTHG